MSATKVPKLTVWRAITLAIFVAGAYATYLRFFHGLHASTNLSDQMPWGMWVGFGTLCGVGLSAGAFALSGAVYVLGMEMCIRDSSALRMTDVGQAAKTYRQTRIVLDYS